MVKEYRYCPHHEISALERDGWTRLPALDGTHHGYYGAILGRETALQEIVLVLPVPPSVNMLWRAHRGRDARLRVYRSKRYTEWVKYADGLMLANAPLGGWPKLKGAFECDIVLDRRSRMDADNGVKAILDYCQRVELIENDRLLERLTVQRGSVSEGCRVTLRGHS